MRTHRNPWRGTGLNIPELEAVPFPSVDWQSPQRLLTRCPRADRTPLRDLEELAAEFDLGRVTVKDERGRMGLGSFKALGAAYVIACDAAMGTAAGTTYVTASAGNHGLSVAAGAAAFGARAVIYISQQVPEAFADRLTAIGAEVVREGSDYEESMTAAAVAAAKDASVLLSDSSWPGYVERPHRLMEGYLVLMQEAFEDIGAPPTHVLVQAGVGGLAGAAAAFVRERWGEAPIVVVVEPEVAPALQESVAAGHPVKAEGPVSIMGRLDCKEPSLIALKGLARDADVFATIKEEEGKVAACRLSEMGLPSTPSGAAGLAALFASAPYRETLGFDGTSRVLAILSEGPEA